ncbi:EAL domain-containing protein [Bradyrhizobium oligotrophicum]|uniref:EAL domain-containing protein n=1 Tax=Bradyrhizobium oligotrophicum TaxID=44255 RepID=UPI003EBB5932
MPVRWSSKRPFGLVAPFIAVLALQASIATLSVEVMSSVRAYVAGESIWSRAQKDAVYALTLYLQSGDQSFYERYRNAMAVPLGDQMARVALQQPSPDLERAKTGFLQGRNDPEDVPGLIWLFRYFNRISYLRAAIEQWEATDFTLLQLAVFGEAVQSEVRGGLMNDPPRIQFLSAVLNDLDDRLSVRANAFSTVLGEGSRAIKSILLLLNVGAASLLLVLVVWHTRRLLAQREAFETALNAETGRLAWQASHDPLTKLANRTVLARCLDAALAGISDGRSAALHLIDLDRFKDVNDSLGHQAGDQLLKAAAHRLTQLVKPADTVARMGGDEFAIVQPDLTGPAEAAALASRIVDEFNKPFDIEGVSVFVGATVGIATAPADGMLAEELTCNADLALYWAKNEGRATHRFFETERRTKAQQRHALQSELRQAVRNDEFELYYQPVVKIDSGEKYAMEALVRWRHPSRGLITPDRFIPIAEETGLIRELGLMVLRRACADAVLWPASVKVAVNLSPVQFRDADLAQRTIQILAETGLAPERLELEITESVLLHRKEENLALLRQLQQAGIRIALDDFGTGYASLSYLRAFPVDKIKIDRSFVSDMSDSDECAAIVCAIANLGRSLSINTTAEGVETEEQLALVKAAGCNLAQGYLFGRPVPLRDVDFGRAVLARSAEVLEDLTATDLMLVRASFSKLAARQDLAANAFYERLFAMAPELRRLFPADLEAQKSKLMATLATGVGKLHDLPGLTPMLKELGARHAGYGARSEHYALVNDAALWMLERCLDRELDAATLRAWKKVLHQISAIMQSGAMDAVGRARNVA